MGQLTFEEAEIWSVAHTDQGYAVLIKPIGIEVAVPIFVGQSEAQSILIGMGDIPMPKPNSHDLLLSAISLSGSNIKKIEITELVDGIFDSAIYFNNINGEQKLEARPSDSIALAVRAECKIFISEAVVKETGVSLEIIKNKTGKLNSEYEKEKAELKNQLDLAVVQENYEKAANLRDKLKKLEQNFF
ncbi:MAG: DUF151 domain-containing protein [Spirochaetales bacterium]|nr:DUF151 domain-containing protein [Spirochaetales bacterium]